MSTFVTTLALDGSAAQAKMDLVDLVVGDAEQRQLLIDGFETGDSSVVVTLIAKNDFTDDDDDPNTLQIQATLSTPSRAPNSRLATFVISSDDTRELTQGRIHRVTVALTRSTVAYVKTVATGFIAATQPGSTAVAPSDEATLRAAGDASVLSAITDKVDSVSGTADRITIGGTPTAPTVDIASDYAGQASINTVGTIGAGVWNGSTIVVAHTQAKVAAVVGVTDRTIVTSSDPQNPIVDIASTYPGQTSIRHLGDIIEGSWNGTAIAANKGGTGLTGFGAIGALLFAATIATLSVLPGNTTAAKKFLNQTGDGTNSAAPAWAQIVSADVSDAASAATASKVVVRDASGNAAFNVLTANSFSGTHNGPVVGNVTGNTTGTHTGDVVGNASTATTLQTARTINGVSFNGSANITVTADASTLTGASLNAGVSVLPAQITGLLSGGLINPTLLPSLAISDTFTVASQAAMLALSAQKGDIAVRSDTSTTFILSGTDPTQLSNWTLLSTPASAVLSVAGKTGVVTLVSADISDAVSTNTASRLVLRDGSGNFAANVITATLTGNASSATSLFNTRTIFGQNFNGTGDVTGNLSAAAGTFTDVVTASASSTAGQFTSSTAGVRGVRVISSSVSNGAAIGLENSSANSAFRNWALAANFNTNAALELIVSTVTGGNPLGSGVTVAKFESNAVTISTGVTISGAADIQGGVKVAGGSFAAGHALFVGATNGLNLVGHVAAGSPTADFTLVNNQNLGGTVMDVPTGTINARFYGSVSVANGFTVSAGTSAHQALTATSGAFSSTLTAVSDFAINTNKFTIAAASGNTVVAGTLSVTGTVSVSSALGVAGDVAVNTNKFTVAAASGNTAIAGSLTVTGTLTTSAQVVSADIASNSNGVDFTIHNGASLVATFSATNQLTTHVGAIKTSNPTTGTAGSWKLGSRVAATVTLVTSQYIELDIGGTLYKIATVS